MPKAFIRLKKKDFYFCDHSANHVINFFNFLRHSKGEWAGFRFELLPWQKFVIGSIFGWRNKADNKRRYRTAYVEVPRKNGKSTLLSGIALYLLAADGESGAEVYSVATKKDQAKIVFDEAKRMAQSSPVLKSRVKIYKNNISFEQNFSKLEPLGSDADTLDGLNIHGAIVDELHAHKTRAVWDVIETATGSRRESLVFAITTAGTDQTGICFEQHEYSKQILNRSITDETYFAYIASFDEGDDWTSPVAWAKANPSYGVSVKEDDLRRLAEKAKAIPAAQNNFLTKRLNKWTQQVDRWLSLELWDANGGIVQEDKLKGKKCYGGLDLSSVSDLTAWVMVFPDAQDTDKVDVLCRLWCPRARLSDSKNRYKDQYRAWEKQGLLTVTEGESIDYAFVKHQILQDAKTFQLVDMNIDRLFQGHQIATELQDEGLNIAAMGMGFIGFALPMKELERRLLAHKINHGGNKPLRWMADNLTVKHDPAGNIKPDKATSQGKIDGIVALVMAIDRAMRHQEGTSIYERRDIIIL